MAADRSPYDQIEDSCRGGCTGALQLPRPAHGQERGEDLRDQGARPAARDARARRHRAPVARAAPDVAHAPWRQRSRQRNRSPDERSRCLKYRLLVAVPFFTLAAFWLALAVIPASQHPALYGSEIELAKLAAFVGCAAAALRFQRGDYLRTGWLLQAQCYLLILLNDVLFRAGMGLFGDASWAPMAGGATVLVANAGQLVGTVWIARVWRVAGFDLAGSPTVRRAVV